jgi:hypothetical protein
MQPTARAAVRGRQNRVLVALAAAWMILSLAIGAEMQADASTRSAPPPAVADRTGR